jgi:hypothetical protein
MSAIFRSAFAFFLVLLCVFFSVIKFAGDAMLVVWRTPRVIVENHSKKLNKVRFLAKLVVNFFD